MDGAKVVTSREFDIYATTNTTTTQDDDGAAAREAQEDCREYDCDSKKDVGDSTSGDTSNADDYNLLSMYMIAGLIQSTHQYYCFSSDDKNNTLTTTTKIMVQTANSATAADTTSNSNDDTPPITMNQTIGATTTTTYNNHNHFNDEKFSEDNSEGLSSWAPSASSCRHHSFNYCDKKAIDNDNRSDEQSSDMGKEERSSASSLDSLASNDVDVECKNYDGPYSVIG